MKKNTLGIIGLLLILSAPLLIWGTTHLHKKHKQSLIKQSMKALGQAQTVYSGSHDEEYELQSGQLANETIQGDPWNMNSKFYSFTMNDIDGKPVPLSAYKGNVLLVVNVASKCGFTKQYAGLQALYEKYQEKGFVVLGFPANDFLSQEPGTEAEIKQFCAINYNVTFPMFSKISVKGKDIHPLYQFLTSPEENGEFGQPITWNFNKFLIGRDGVLVGYFGSKVEPLDPQLTSAIEEALGGL